MSARFMMTTRVRDGGKRIDIDLDPRCTKHFREWAALFAAVRYIERERIVTSVFLEIVYERVTGRSPYHTNPHNFFEL